MPNSALLRLAFRRLALAVGACALAAPAAAGSTAVYKCFDRNLNVLYTDQPCAGEVLEIRAGDPDAAALAALQKERDALAKSIAQRIVESRQPREPAPAPTYVLPPATPPAYAAYDVSYPAWYVNAPVREPRRGRGDAAGDERRDPAGNVPNPLPPRNSPRR